MPEPPAKKGTTTTLAAALSELENFGLTIQAVRRIGYTLSRIQEERIKARLSQIIMQKQ
ncbi:unnamed protein product [Umbelopsis ramanniana]